jgi:hypothetical protein
LEKTVAIIKVSTLRQIRIWRQALEYILRPLKEPELFPNREIALHGTAFEISDPKAYRLGGAMLAWWDVAVLCRHSSF